MHGTIITWNNNNELLHIQLKLKKRLGMDSILRDKKDQWWENIGCIIIVRVVFEPASAVKSLTSFLISVLRCHANFENLPRFYEDAWSNILKKYYQPVKDFHVYQHTKHQVHDSIPSWDIAMTLHPCYF